MRFAIALLFLISNPIFAADDVSEPAAELPVKDSMVTLGKVDAETSTGSTLVNIRFDQPLDWESVAISDHGSFIQVELPGTVIPNPGDFFDGSGDYLKKLAVFQITPDTGALRLFLSKDASLVKESLKADILGDRVLVTIDHQKLESLVANDPQVTASPDTSKTAEEVIATTAVDSDLPAPADMVQAKADDKQSSSSEDAAVVQQNAGNAAQEAVQTGSQVFDFKDKFVNVAVFCAILLLGMAVLLMAAPKLRKARRTFAPKEELKMRSLGSHVVAPKQKLELIDVGGQQILIGVTPGNINYLTTIASPSQQQLAAPMTAGQPRQLMSQMRPKEIPQSSKQPPNSAISQPKRPPVKNPYVKSQPKPKQNEAINDVTKLIREKLKSIPSV